MSLSTNPNEHSVVLGSGSASNVDTRTRSGRAKRETTEEDIDLIAENVDTPEIVRILKGLIIWKKDASRKIKNLEDENVALKQQVDLLLTSGVRPSTEVEAREISSNIATVNSDVSSVETTVSPSRPVSRPVTPPPPPPSHLETQDEIEDRRERKRAIVIRNLYEPRHLENMSDRARFDYDSVVEILSKLGVPCLPVSVYRMKVGDEDSRYDRLVKCILPSSSHQQLILKNAFKLSSDPIYYNVYLRPSLTFSERGIKPVQRRVSVPRPNLAHNVFSSPQYRSQYHTRPLSRPQPLSQSFGNVPQSHNCHPLNSSQISYWQQPVPSQTSSFHPTSYFTNRGF